MVEVWRDGGVKGMRCNGCGGLGVVGGVLAMGCFFSLGFCCGFWPEGGLHEESGG